MNRRRVDTLHRLAARLVLSLCGVGAITFLARGWLHVNQTTAGFGYLLLVLIVASVWGFTEAAVASVAATLAFNFFFLPPVGTFTIADPQNWVALTAFLITSLVAGRLSTAARQREIESNARREDVERLYTFSRAILLIGGESFARQLAQRLADIFELEAVALYERGAGEFHHAGPSEFDGMEDQLRDAAARGQGFADPARRRVITAVRLGSEPIASLGLQGKAMPDAVVQGIANLAAIGLERARAHELANQVEAARQSERLRTTLIDAMAHELKTPLTSIKAATSALVANPDQPPAARADLLEIAAEEVERLQELIDNAVEMARLDTAQIDVQLAPADLEQIARDVVASMAGAIEDRPVEVAGGEGAPIVAVDRRLVALALKQLLDNALKYSPPGTPVTVTANLDHGVAAIEVADRGSGIPEEEQKRIFDRFYRGAVTNSQIPGAGLGLSIAARIARAHRGDLTVASRPGRTVFRMEFPFDAKGGC